MSSFFNDSADMMVRCGLMDGPAAVQNRARGPQRPFAPDGVPQYLAGRAIFITGPDGTTRINPHSGGRIPHHDLAAPIISGVRSKPGAFVQPQKRGF